MWWVETDLPDRVTLDPSRMVRRLLKTVLWVTVGLLVADYLFNFFDVADNDRVRRLFNVAREESVPTWFASTQALALAVTAWVLSRADSPARRGWLGVATFFLYVSVDDAAKVHERLGSALGEVFEDREWAADFPSYTWQLFVAPVLGLALLWSVLFIWRRVSGGYRRWAVVGLAGFGVAQAIDFLEGVEGLFEGWSERLEVGEYTVSHGLLATEELLEMLSTTAIWSVLLIYLAGLVSGLRIELD